MFIVIESTPGYLPDSDPIRVDSFAEALEVLAELDADLTENYEYERNGEIWTAKPGTKLRNGKVTKGLAFAEYFDPYKDYTLGRCIEVCHESEV